jgi:beta-glucosidase
VVTIEVTAQDMASYDWDDANNNGFAGYELEAGTYGLAVQRNSHDIVFTQDFTVASGIQCKTDLVTGAEIKALAEEVARNVKYRFGVELEPEPVIL